MVLPSKFWKQNYYDPVEVLQAGIHDEMRKNTKTQQQHETEKLS